MRENVVSVQAGGEACRVTIGADGRATTEGKTFDVATTAAPGEMLVSTGTAIERVFLVSTPDAIWVFQDGETFEVTIEAEGAAPRKSQQGSLAAPMPATTVSVNVHPGDRVTKGMILIVLEAMKMELPIRAPADGVVAAVHCKSGELVQPGLPLIEIR